MMYVTYHWILMHGNRSNLKAIECDTIEKVRKCTADICSLHGIRNVRLNLSGRLRNKYRVTVITREEYKNNKYLKK